MPNRGYYLDEDEKSVGLRTNYMTFLNAMLTASGVDNTEGRAQAVMAFETAMARSHWKPTKRRNRDLTYNKMTPAELTKYAPGFDWKAMMTASGLGDQKAFVVREKDALQGLAKTFGATPLAVIKDYMTIHYISANAAYLPSAIDTDNFSFYGKSFGAALKCSGSAGNAALDRLAIHLVK